MVHFLKTYDLELLGDGAASVAGQEQDGLEMGFKRALTILQRYRVLLGRNINPSISELRRRIKKALKRELGAPRIRVKEGMTGIVYKRIVRMLNGISSRTFMAFLRFIYCELGDKATFKVYKVWRMHLRGLVDEVDYLWDNCLFLKPRKLPSYKGKV